MRPGLRLEESPTASTGLPASRLSADLIPFSNIRNEHSNSPLSSTRPLCARKLGSSFLSSHRAADNWLMRSRHRPRSKRLTKELGTGLLPKRRLRRRSTVDSTTESELLVDDYILSNVYLARANLSRQEQQANSLFSLHDGPLCRALGTFMLSCYPPASLEAMKFLETRVWFGS